jgi:hypothetical protein
VGKIALTQLTSLDGVLLGAGDRLFGETPDKIALRLVESRPVGGGVVSRIYAPATTRREPRP